MFVSHFLSVSRHALLWLQSAVSFKLLTSQLVRSGQVRSEPRARQGKAIDCLASLPYLPYAFQLVGCGKTPPSINDNWLSRCCHGTAEAWI